MLNCLVEEYYIQSYSALGFAKIFFKNLFSLVILRLYTEFQSPTMLGTGQKVCGGWWWVGGGCVSLF